MVVVTKDNFSALLPDILARLERATFVAFDLEMTGIFSHYDRNQRDDDVVLRYPRMVPTATKYSIVQIGLSFFEPSPAGDGFVASPYSFFIFPEWGSDIVMSSSSITFLKQNGMDFNQWIINGIPFVDTRGAQNLKEVRDKREAAAAAMAAAAAATEASSNSTAAPVVAPVELVPNKPEDVVKLAEQKEAIKNFAADAAATELVIPPLFPFVRKCVYQHIETIYPHLRTKKGEVNYSIVVMKVDASEQERMDAEEVAKMNEKLGFRSLWEALAASKKPMVGHNCNFDLLFMFRWLDRPLPPSFVEFKARFNEVLGEVYDTKFLASGDLLGASEVEKETDLATLYKSTVVESATFSSEAKLSFAEGFAYDEKDKQAHDAGYDAFMTGSIFAANIAQVGFDKIKAEAKNKLFLMQSLYNMSLEPGEPHSTLRIKGDIYYLEGFPADANNDIIWAALGVTGVELQWINGTSLFVVASAGTVLAVELPDGWRMITFQEFEDARERIRNPPALVYSEDMELVDGEEELKAPKEGEPEAKKARTT